MDPTEDRCLKIRRRGHSLELMRHLAELLCTGKLTSTAKALLCMTLDAKAARKIQSPFQVIFQILMKLATVHSLGYR